ncbi:hypothetical protein FEZ51_02185 [Pediococcus stilesii]|uniref:Prophage tail endopeptidase domain-containing protein n=1 Tax=Pediococcus stilesii TaxID=331679 RepID=A0A5R9BXP6_9LACO|nr:prophage endopeptidase tail family protein [Pediococcus stilesii]TLQ05486.1 hypothetical protein FEZ51_02185 [Pediococcus stilesii]
MNGYPKIVVRDKDVNPTFSEVVLGVDPATVSWDRTLNETYSLTFTAYEYALTNAAFNMLTIGHWIVWNGQIYQISNMESDEESGIYYKNITAINAWFATKRIQISYYKAGKQDYHASELLKYAFDGNKYGYSYELMADDKPTVNIENLGEVSAYQILTNYIIGELHLSVIPDGKLLKIMSLDDLKRDTGQTLFYYHNTSQISAQFDIESIVNCINVYGKVKDANKHTYDFQTVIKDDNSIRLFGECWGEAIHDDEITDQKSAQAAAADTLSPTPEVSMSTDLIGVTAELGDVFKLKTFMGDDVADFFEMGVMATQITSTPYTGDPDTVSWSKGMNNIPDIKTFIDIQAKQANNTTKLSKLETNQNQMSGKINTAYEDRLSGRLINSDYKIVQLEAPIDNADLGLIKGQAYSVATRPEAVEGLSNFIKGSFKVATTSSDGLFGKTDKQKLDSISTEPPSEVKLKSPDGSIFMLSISNDGTISAKKQ